MGMETSRVVDEFGISAMRRSSAVVDAKRTGGLRGRIPRQPGTPAAGMVLTTSATHWRRIGAGVGVVALEGETDLHLVHDNACCRRPPSHATQGTAIALPMAL